MIDSKLDFFQFLFGPGHNMAAISLTKPNGSLTLSALDVGMAAAILAA
jgi:hypothetical protein